MATGIVLFTDGGARPTNPGWIGWGVHGYFYTTEPSKQGAGLDKYTVTNKGYVPNAAPASKDTEKVTPVHYYDILGGGGRGSNNAAELTALISGIRYLLKEVAEIPNIQVYTDSEYVRRGTMEGIRIWKSRNWIRPDGTPYPNKELWIDLDGELDCLARKGIEIKIDWVRGHNDNLGNVKADRFATVGALRSINEDREKPWMEATATPAKGYWKVDVERNPFFTHKFMYFNSLKSEQNKGVYYMADPSGTELIIGRKLPDAAYSVIRMNEPDPAIEAVMEHQHNCSDDMNAIMALRLEKLYHKEVWPMISKYGKNCMLQYRRQGIGLRFLDKEPITTHIDPVGLGIRAVENFCFLNEILDRFILVSSGGQCPIAEATDFQYKDITTVFFDVGVKKKMSLDSATNTMKRMDMPHYTLRPEYSSGPSGVRMVKVPVTVVKPEKLYDVQVPMVLGADVPARNNLKRMEDYCPKIFLVAWSESDRTIRYASVIQSQAGIGIWSNFFADRLFLL